MNQARLPRARHLAALVAAIALASVGCGGDEDAATTGVAPIAPASPPRTPALCAGPTHTCVAKVTGEVICWGANLDGQLGDGTGETRTAPVNVVGVRDAVGLACGHDHTCALLASGAVQCWGSNAEGEVGDGSHEVRATAVNVQGISDASAIVAGHDFTCALRRDGAVSCWGSNSSSALGNGENAGSATPVAVSGLSDAVEIAAGRSHVCARRSGGRVSCWGSDSDGQLGTPGGHAASRVPVEVAGLAGVTHVAAGHSNTCAVSPAGMHCWGDGYAGHLLNGKTGFEADEAAPVLVAGVADVAEIGIGESTICVRTNTGSLKCWGEGSSGQIGNGTGEDATAPTDVNRLSDVSDLAVGGRHLCALRRTGALACWGANYIFQINGSQDRQTAPLELASDVAQLTGETSAPPSFPAAGAIAATPAISVGDDHACATQSNGTPVCWGSNAWGQLGNNSTRSENQGVVNPLGLTDVIAVSAGPTHTCAIRADKTVACWGNNEGGNGTGRRGLSSRPVPVQGITDARAISAGRRFTCILRETGTLSCFGSGGYGTLGNGAREHSLVPVEVPQLSGVAQVSAASSHACALRENGEVWCWGSGSNGQLGHGSETQALTPTQVPGLADIIDLDAYDTNTCAVRRNGRVVCWGSTRYGALGNGNVEVRGFSSTPVEVRGLRDALAVSVGTSAACALRRGGKVSCWGGNSFGQAGINNPALDPVAAPLEVYVDGADATLVAYGRRTQVECGRNFCCSLHETGHVSCWGAAPGFGTAISGGRVASRSPKPVAIGFIELGTAPTPAPAPAAE